MLALVEPCITDDLLDRPHLGCAMLIAACQEKSIKTTLIKGQTCYLRDMFINDSEELWGLIEDLKEDALKKIGITEFKRFFQERGIKGFRDELKGLYQYVIIDKDPRHYLNAQMLEKFRDLHNILIAIYFYYLKEFKYNKLKIIDRYISEILKTNPRYIGFSLQGRFDPLSRIIRKRIKEVTGIPIIVGGALSPFIDLKKLDKTFEQECFDCLAIGAGEHSLPALIETLDSKKEPRGIANIFYKKDNKIKGNDLEVIDDLDTLPYPDFSQFDLDLYLTPDRILPLQTARGCRWGRCAFCSYHKISLGKRRIFSTEKIIETLRYLNKVYHCQFFSFDQEELCPDQAKRISKAILSNDLEGINIYSPVRLEDDYNNITLLRLMRKAGFVQLHWGVESGNQRVLDLMNKGTNVKTMGQILRKSFKSKISNICFIFFGFPGETKKEARETIEFLKRHAMYIDDISHGVFVLDEYAPVGVNPEKWGVEEVKDDSTYSVKMGMGRKEANAFYSKFHKEFFQFNSIKVTSRRLNYLSRGHYRVMACFLMSAHDILSKRVVREDIKKGKRKGIFPLILGEIKKRGEGAVFYPININETWFINQWYPEKEEILDRLEERLVILSNGTLSIEDIVLTTYKDFMEGYSKKDIAKKSTDFFQRIAYKHWGLFFAKFWPSF